MMDQLISVMPFNQWSTSQLVVGIALLGLIIGSFLNVVIIRLPIMLFRQWKMDAEQITDFLPDHPAIADTEQTYNLMKPDSQCRNCQTAIKPWHNIPLLGFLLLRGKCPNCQTKIGWRYPAVEFLTAVVSVILLLTQPLTGALLALLLFSWLLIALTVIDIDYQILPDQLTLPLLWLGLIINTQSVFVPLQDAVLGAVIGYLSLWSVYWIFKLVTGKEGMGAGDFKLLAALGAWLGWTALPMIILLSSVVGAVIGLLMIVFAQKDHQQPIPFGPYLAGAGFIAAVWGDSILQLYLATFGLI